MTNNLKLGEHSLVLFDGFCNLCNASVQAIIKRDQAGIHHFASLESSVAKQILGNFPDVPQDIDSIVLICDQEIFYKSDAVLQIAKSLGGMTRFLYPLRRIPKPIRDRVYDWVARNRYDWFGKQETCMIPAVAIRSRFLP